MEVDLMSREELEALVNERNHPCISIYLPMVRFGPDVRGNHIRLKNALNELEDRFQEEGWSPENVDKFLEEPRLLLENDSFWKHQSNGLAVFFSPDTFARYRLPLEFKPLTVVSDRFHAKPLLPLFSDDGRFYILALSQNEVRLFQGTRFQVDEIELKYAPKSMAEALAFDDPEEQLQHHTTSSGAGGAPAVVHHGHGVIDDEEKQRLRRYFEQVSKGVHRQLEGIEAPLVLAGVEYLHPIYTRVDTSPHLLDEGILGNPEHLNVEVLHQKAWDIVRPIFETAKRDAVNRYNQLSATEQISDDLEEIVPIAYQGRIDTLFVASDVEMWGKYDPDNDLLELHDEPQEGDEDLLDFAAIQTLAYGGTVYAVDAGEVPGNSSVAAIIRF